MKKSVFFLVFLCAAVNSIAQRNNLYTLESPYERYTYNLLTLSWAGAIPTGTITDGYIDKPSLSNYKLSLEWVFRGSPISAGLETGRYYFEQRYPRATYQIGENEVSAVKTSTFNLVPITGFVKYHFLGTNARFSPYVQANIGAHINRYVDYYGSLGDQKRKVGIGFAGGAGFKYFIKKDGQFGLDVAARYDQNTFRYGYVENGLGMITGSVGFFYRWW